MRALLPRLLGLLLAGTLALPVSVGPSVAWAKGDEKPSGASAGESAGKTSGKEEAQRLASVTAKGRPTVKLDRLDFPDGVANGKHYRKFLRRRLEREARRARWGAGRNNVIEYRFAIKELHITTENNVLRVRCTAVGRLPKGQAAKSQLTYGGDPRKSRKVVENVLAIVARGVISRLSELERIRRGDLKRSNVRAPATVD